MKLNPMKGFVIARNNILSNVPHRLLILEAENPINCLSPISDTFSEVDVRVV